MIRSHRTRIAAVLTSLLIAAPALAASTVKASSEGKDTEGNAHPAAHAFDGQLTTGWAEGDSGSGKGAWIEVKLDKPTDVASVSIWPGRLQLVSRSLREYGRPSYVTVTLTTPTGPVTQQVRLLDPGDQGAFRQDVPIVAAKATAMRITIDEAVKGGIFDLTFIAEVAINLVAGENGPPVAPYQAWLASPAGQAAVAKDREEIIALFNQIKAAEFGDRDALAEIMTRAADGAPALRAQAQKQVPHGFRIQALPPDDSAIQALLKLRDANAIPAIELASLRVTGPAAQKLGDQASMFEAYGQMVGGGRRNIPAWGDRGWEKGALQGLGEPIAIAVSQYGDIFVADTANNRVQRFDPKGVAQQAWGLDPDITNIWFGRTRAWYASGSRPGTDPGAFTNPVSIALVPAKGGEGFAALDALGRVTVTDAEGKVTATFQVPTGGGNISPGVGGEGHIVRLGKKLAVIWGNEGWTFGLDGTEEGHFTLEDGSPSGAVALGKNLGLVYRDQLVQYSTTGFRYGELLDGALGTGFETWGAAVDEKGKLWAVLDTGEVVKFKKPGQVELRFKLTDWSLTVPRIAVYDDFVYVTSGDKIVRGDALELAAAEAPKAGG